LTNSAGGETNRLSTRAKIVIVAGLTAILMLVAVLCAEFAIRVRQKLRYGTQATVEDLYRVDARLNLRVPIANLKSGRIEINSLGFRGPEIVQPKPANTVRIAFLGASTTWCGEVSGNDKVWPHLVVKELQRSHSRSPIDYVNGGVPGYVVKSSLNNLTNRVAPLLPDIIVIYHATNDLSGEMRDVAAAKGVIPHAQFVPPHWLSNHSLLWNLAEKNYRVWISQRQVNANVGRLEVDARQLGGTFHRDLTELIRAAKQRSKRVAVATFSTQLRSEQSVEQQLSASASALYYMPFMTPRGLIDGYRRYNEIIREVATETGALLIDGENEIPGEPQHFTDTVHFTDAGSNAMAARVIRVLSKDPTVRVLLEN
jgi:lysophospholipase L1-like esterase